MRYIVFWFVILSMTWSAHTSEEMRIWSSRTGTKVKASFQKEERGLWFLKGEDGGIMQVKPAALSDEDQAYVLNLTYEPRLQNVVFHRIGNNRAYTEKGEPVHLCFMDTVTLCLDVAGGMQPANVINNTTWKIESVESLGQVLQRQQGFEERKLHTEGLFVILKCKVTNDGQVPVRVVTPKLVDARGRLFTHTQNANWYSDIPPGVLLAGQNNLQPNLTKSFYALYEIPADTAIEGVQVYPTMSGNPLINWPHTCEGKCIYAKPQAGFMQTGDSAALKSVVFMNCVRLGTSGNTSGRMMRSVSYAADVRLMGDVPRNVVVKGYFIGDGTSSSRDRIFSMSTSAITLDPGRSERVTLASDENARPDQYASQFGQRTGRNRNNIKGVVIQAWIDKEIVVGWASLPQYRKYAENTLIEQELEIFNTGSQSTW